ncbi:hypothetical protein BDA96_01G384400 [Sorghum bicolor]|uniref:Peroxidase n=1 Tax=Sorghum bicolor TaxID=4558 RepID=A0A921S426_SORBI|nr:hypothetical protein BDA96_01G384400 [Sorghum bicolor]
MAIAATSPKMSSVLAALSLLLLAVACQASPYYPLELGYYRYKCPQAEAIVKAIMEKAIAQNPGNGAGLIRMLFHDCFVEGCDASVLLDPTPFSPTPEKTSPPNNPSLRGFELIDAIKDALEAACPGVVSCADIIAFAARDASYFLSGGKVRFDMPAGRLDGTFSNASESLKFLVPPTSNLSTLVSSFAVKGMSVEDLVVLSGAHTVGRSHCSSFVSDRLNASVPSDADLLTSAQTAKLVLDNANIPGWWEDKFEKAMVKMASIEVKTGYQGQVRKNCRAINHY